MSACERVINIFELLEAILTDIPLREVLLLQRVCKAFYNFVHGSSKMSQALNYAPAYNAPKYMLPSVLPNIFKYKYIGPYHGDDGQAKELYFSIGRSTTRKLLCSWKDMLLVQPPITETRMWVIPTLEKDSHLIEKKTLQCQTGITLGLMMTSARELLKSSKVEGDLVYFGGIVDSQGGIIEVKPKAAK